MLLLGHVSKIVSILLSKLSDCPNTDTLLCYYNYPFLTVYTSVQYRTHFGHSNDLNYDSSLTCPCFTCSKRLRGFWQGVSYSPDTELLVGSSQISLKHIAIGMKEAIEIFISPHFRNSWLSGSPAILSSPTCSLSHCSPRNLPSTQSSGKHTVVQKVSCRFVVPALSKLLELASF